MINAPKIGWGPKPLQDYLDELAAYIDSIKPVAGIGTAVYDVPGGRAINAGPGGAGGNSASGAHPFQVTTRNDESLGWQAKVELNSTLLRSLKVTDRQTITGLDTWFTLIATDLIWLSITISSFATTAATIRSYGQGHSEYTPSASAWATGGYIESSNNSNFFTAQNIARVMIAFSLPDGDGNPDVTQACFTHLLMQNISVADASSGQRAAIYPFPAPTTYYG